MKLDSDLISAMVQARRGGRSFRLAAIETGGLSAATLCRIEQGQLPTSEASIERLCAWLGVELQDIQVDEEASPRSETLRQIEALLNADPALSERHARALFDALRGAYNVFTYRTL